MTDYPKATYPCQTKRNELLAGMKTADYARFVALHGLTLASARLQQQLRRSAEKPVVLLCDNDRDLLTRACACNPVKGASHKDTRINTYIAKVASIVYHSVFDFTQYPNIWRKPWYVPTCADSLRYALGVKKLNAQLKKLRLDDLRKKTKTLYKKPWKKCGCRGTDVSARLRK